MSDTYDWTEFEGDRWSPENIGDSITGYVTKIETETSYDKRSPVLTLQVDTQGRERTVKASQTQLKRVLAELNVQVGDKVRITLHELVNTGQPQPMKVFDVQHRAGEAHAASQAPSPAAPEPDPVPADHDPDLDPF